MKTTIGNTNQEKAITVKNGWVMLPLDILLILAGPAMLITSIVMGAKQQGPPVWALFIPAILVMIASFIMLFGFFAPHPILNRAASKKQ